MSESESYCNPEQSYRAILRVVLAAMAICYPSTSKCPYGRSNVQTTNIFKFRVSFRVSIRFRVKLDYIRLDSVRLKVLLARLTSRVYMHL